MYKNGMADIFEPLATGWPNFAGLPFSQIS